MEITCVYLEFLIKFIQTALGSYCLFWTIWSRHITVKYAGTYDGTTISGFPSRDVDTSSTPELKLHQANMLRHTGECSKNKSTDNLTDIPS